VFREFLQDAIAAAGVGVVSLGAQELDSLVDVAVRFNLDFDGAYHYRIAIKHGIRVVGFDTDFDRTAEGRLLPADVV
jgi:predicted nucleic acid-binding protein